MSSFKSTENIQKKEGVSDRFVSVNQSSSVTLNELAMKARKDTVISSLSFVITKPASCTAAQLISAFVFAKQIVQSLYSQMTNVQSTKSEAAVTVRNKSVSCFTPTCVNTVNACL